MGIVRRESAREAKELPPMDGRRENLDCWGQSLVFEMSHVVFFILYDLAQ
jgi:hypothetical protein